MNKTNLCVICTKNPNVVLLNTINGIKRFYPEFDIVVVDSDSTNMEGFRTLPTDVTVEFIKNKNWELGAWTYAYNKYNNYKIYMFLQDCIEPIQRIPNFHTNTFENETLYSFHHTEVIERGQFSWVPKKYMEQFNTVYQNTPLEFIHNIPRTQFTLTCHTSFITNNTNVRTLIQLEDAYIEKNIKKTKVDSCITERTCGLLADLFGNKRIDITPFFKKRSLGRDYLWQNNCVIPLP
jgi:hypothetical protein